MPKNTSIMHGSWLEADDQGRFVFWGERVGEPTIPLPDSGDAYPVYRYSFGAVSLQYRSYGSNYIYYAPDEVAHLLNWGVGDEQSYGTSPYYKHYTACYIALPDAEPPARLRGWQICGFAPPAETTLLTLARIATLPLPSVSARATSRYAALPGYATGAPHFSRKVGADLLYWSAAARFVLELLAQGRYVLGVRETNSGVTPIWQALLDVEGQERLATLAAQMPAACRALAHDADELTAILAGKATPATDLLTNFVTTMLDACVREKLAPKPKEETRSYGGFNNYYSLQNRNKANDRATGYPLIYLYQPPRPPDPADNYQVVFRLEPPGDVAEGGAADIGAAALADEEAQAGIPAVEPPVDEPANDVDDNELDEIDDEVNDDEAAGWRLRLFLRPNDDRSLLLPANLGWRAPTTTLHAGGLDFARPHERLLTALAAVARLCPSLAASLHTSDPTLLHLDLQTAYDFLRQASSLLEQAGYGVIVPSWWVNRPRLAARLVLDAPTAPANESSGLLNFDDLIQYDWQVSVGDQPLDPAEFMRLAALKQPLVQVRGEWVELSQEQVAPTLAFLKQRRGGRMSLGEAVRLSLAQTDGVLDEEQTRVVPRGWLRLLLDRLTDNRLEQLPPPAGFSGTLRPYQLLGYAWLNFLRQYGFGACLADDMGLGKTIQLLALLQYEREQGIAGPTLLICPTSVVGNWQHEAARFTPNLRVLIHHGSTRKRDDAAFAEQAQSYDMIVSSYALTVRDEKLLAGVKWRNVVLDEAQNIKNPTTRQARAIRKLPASHRVALTGTPVENRLSELWSIMDFLNPGYLGNQEQFRRKYSLPIERDHSQAAVLRLRKLTQPFILRRLKTDPRIIQDLPIKNEMKVYCNLTVEQASLYQAYVNEIMAQIEAAEKARKGVKMGQNDMARRGLVLKLLVRLKQICNHPTQFLNDESAMAGRSGKLARLEEMLEEALAEGDKALIFSQFAEMGSLLQPYLRDKLGVEVLYLHGGTPRERREDMVQRFQSEGGPPLFILSLKAGGTGLNLTAANHVFHYDRWWNPAVENQATDRAFRIGQTRSVQVHKFVCVGTLEERIDQLIESKQALAESVIGGDSEGWLTELSTADLRDLVRLSADAVGE